MEQGKEWEILKREKEGETDSSLLLINEEMMMNFMTGHDMPQYELHRIAGSPTGQLSEALSFMRYFTNCGEGQNFDMEAHTFYVHRETLQKVPYGDQLHNYYFISGQFFSVQHRCNTSYKLQNTTTTTTTRTEPEWLIHSVAAHQIPDMQGWSTWCCTMHQMPQKDLANFVLASF